MPLTLIGVIGAFAAFMVGMVIEGGKPAELIASPSPLIFIFATTPLVTIAGHSMSDLKVILAAGLKAIKPEKKVNTAATVTELISFADTARREGLLALEEKAKAVTDPFLKRGIELVVDGSDPEAVEDTLHRDLDKLKERHKVGQKFFADAGGFAPTMGVIGTVLGLVFVLQNLSDPEKLGHLIATAFIATLWGVLSANVFFLPVANKLKRLTAIEVAHKEVVIEGVLSIQAGHSPRAVGEALKSHLPPKLRESVTAKPGAAA